jgi:hypothetical protein
MFEGGTLARRVVERIDCQRQANVCQVHADLMRFAGFREDAKERVMPESFLDTPQGKRGPTVFENGHPFWRGWMWLQRRIDFAMFLVCSPSNQR